MPKRDQEKYNIRVEGEPKEVTAIREKILETFDGLEFVEEGHKYYKNGKELISVSEFISRFEEEFDTENKAIKYAFDHGETPEYWMGQWRFNNLKATVSGTQCHSYAESCGWIKAGHPENIVPDQLYKYVSDKKWLIPTRPKEEAAAKFWDELDPRFHIVMPETKVFTDNPNYGTNFAGTFDLLLYFKHPTDDRKNGLVLMDWKTNASIYKDFSRARGKMLYQPFDDLYAEPFGAYTIQQNAYALAMRDKGINVIGKRLIWLKDDATYEIVKIGDYVDRIQQYLLTH